jgi:macrolide transport system ATP-binding/permease protein
MLSDLRYAIRTLRHNPGFAVIAILSLALGIGANTAIFSLAEFLLLRPLPVPRASEVVVVQAQLRGESTGLLQEAGLSYPDFIDLQRKSKSFAGLTASQYFPFGFAHDRTTQPKMKYGALVSGNFFDVLGVRPGLGRSFRADEDKVPGRDAVVVLGHDLWETEFVSSPDVVGKSIFLNGLPFTVVGVAPEPFRGPIVWMRADLYVPLAMQPALAGGSQQNELEMRGLRALRVQGRLKPGVSVRLAAAEARVLSEQLAQEYPETNRTCWLEVGTFWQTQIEQYPIPAMAFLFMMALAGVVLLIACANIMNLMLSRASARSREIAVRMAVGAGRVRLIRLLLTESLVIAILGGALGLLIAQAVAALFSRFRIPSDIPIVLDFGLDSQVLLFALLVSAASAILFGLAPALQSTKPDLVAALKSGAVAEDKQRRFLGRNALVIAQVAGSLLLLVFATQIFRGLSILLSSPLGFRADHVLTAGFNPMLARDSMEQTKEFYRQLLDQARTLTGVKSAALSQSVPLMETPALSQMGGFSSTQVIPEGVQLPTGTETVRLISNTVSEGYFRTIGVPIVDGREFLLSDRADTPRVVIVNEQFARNYYPSQGAIGKRLRLNGATGPFAEIVGVAKQSTYLNPFEPPLECLYLPLAQNPTAAMTLMLETEGPPAEEAGPLRDLVRRLDTNQPIYAVRSMQEVCDLTVKQRMDVIREIVGGLGLLGLVLALVGLYGLMTYSVSLRYREIGIRMAIGAAPVAVVRMVLKQGMGLAGSGVVIGLLLSLAVSKPTTAMVGGHGFNLPLVALVTIALLAMAGVGAYLPARRASRVDPNTVLRQE